MDEAFAALVTELKEQHGCHTVVLYGSRARSDWTEASDYDVLGIREGGPAVRDARAWRDGWLDAFIAPEAGLLDLDPGALKLLGGRVLVERDGLGTRLLEAVTAYHDAGPPPLAAWDREELLAGHARDVAGGREITVLTDGMRCAACAWLIDRALAREDGVLDTSANAITGGQSMTTISNT